MSHRRGQAVTADRKVEISARAYELLTERVGFAPGDINFDPYLNASYSTWLQMWQDTWSNGLFNGIEAAVSAVLAQRVAMAVIPSLGIGKAKAAAAGAATVDPFAEPEDEQAGVAAASPSGSDAAPTEGELA